MLPASPEGPEPAVLGDSVQKDLALKGREGDAFVFERMMPSMHIKLQSAAGLREEREAQGRMCLLLAG